MDLYSKLEQEFCKFTGYKYAIAVNSGTSGLHLALEAIGVEGGDVIIPDFTMAACAFAVSYARGNVVTVDCDSNLNMNPNLVKITPKTKAIMPVHVYGRKAYTDYPIPTVVDMSEAHGIECTGDIAVYSLYKNKIVHAEEGGMVVTNNKEYADKIRDMKNMSFGKKHDFHHKRIGYNYRMPESQAKLALKSLRDVKKNLKKRKQINNWYNEFLGCNTHHDVDWVYDIMVDNNKIVDNIPESRYFFKPISSFPMYNSDIGKNAMYASKRGLYLPIDPKFTKRNVKKICDKLLSEMEK